ncbi:hypothetical protein [Vibrio splendidus]|uniref:hypothetical protein n=1 Tax=Vibrio splendidus TaxID=29497 RepID=UPI00080E6C68|nr:hypothetical protein [Vibrio splendidus]OCH61889.1 hypothetical protein A6D94_17090 [Vibrio splendidus]
MIKQTADAVYTTRFLNLLRQDFKRWTAYKIGVIDAKGNLIRKPKSNETQHYTKFHSLVRNIKQQIERVGGRPASTALAAKLLLSETNITGDHGGNTDDIAAGKPSGNIVNTGPMTFKTFRKRQNEKRNTKANKKRA